MKAFLSIHFTPGQEIEPEYVFHILKEEGIEYGVDIDKVKELCLNKQDVYDEVIAEGTYSIPGEDADIAYFYSKPDYKPRYTEDGRIDYYELGNIIAVKKGDRIAQRKPATEGIPGCNVCGETIPALAGKNQNFQTGKGIEIINNQALAKYDGALHWQGTKILVNRLMIVKGNVDFSVGNINFPGKVKISGSVLSGFQVEAEEDIEIAGGIEDAKVFSQKGSIFIHRGIIGMGKAIVKAAVNVESSFIQEATVEAGKNIIANEYIIRSNIKAGESVMVQGSRGKVMGSNDIVAGSRIMVNTVQTSKDLNLMIAGINRNATYLRIKEINQSMNTMEAQIRSMSVKVRMLATTKKQNDTREIREALAEYVAMIDEVEQLKAERMSLVNMLKSTKGEGMIEVKKEVEHGLSLKIKEERIEISRNLADVTIYYDHEEKRIVVIQN